MEEEINKPEMPQPQQEVPRPKRKLLIPVLIVAAVLGLAAAGYFIFIHDTAVPESDDAALLLEAEQKQEDPNTIRMLATGDFIAHDAINLQAKTAEGAYDYLPMLTEMRPFFKDSDINFCNQATLAGGEAYGITGYPIFNAPSEWIDAMSDLGCNVINTGTNHTNDKGQAAITAQLEKWDSKGNIYAVAGSNRSSDEQSKVRYFEVKGVKFAFVSYSTYSNTPNPNPYSLSRFNDELVVPQMTEATMQADVVIVSMRWGTEYSETINTAQEQQAQKLTDLGADIILGHGTHTLQPVKRLKGTLPDGSPHESIVWYGLGNFLNAQLETSGLTGCVATFNIDVPSKKITDTTCLPFYMHYEWTAEEKAKEDLLARQNFKIVPLETAQELLAKSQLDTTVEAQINRIQMLLNTYTKVSITQVEGL